MSSDSDDCNLVITEIKSEVETDLNEEDLLGASQCSDDDDDLSVGTSDFGDLLDNETLFNENECSSQSEMKQVLKPSQRNPITAPGIPKCSAITRISAPVSLSSSVSPSPLSLKCNKILLKPPKVVPNTARLATISSHIKKPTLIQKQSSIDQPGSKVKLSRTCPVKAPENSHKSLISTNSHNSHRPEMLCSDFVFDKPEQCPVRQSDRDFDDQSVLGCEGAVHINNVEPSVCSRQGSKPSPLLPKVKTSPQPSVNSNPFKDESYPNSGNASQVVNSVSISPWGPAAKIAPNDGAPVFASKCSSHPHNPFLSQWEKSPQRLVTYSESATSTSVPATHGPQPGLSRKSTIIKLNRPKVFRYVPEELPEVELPDLATKKWTSRKRINSNHRDECPDILLETKRHCEDDLRSVLTAQRSSTSELRNNVRIVTCQSSSSTVKSNFEHKNVAEFSPSIESTTLCLQEESSNCGQIVNDTGHAGPAMMKLHIDCPVLRPTDPLVESTSNIQKRTFRFASSTSSDSNVKQNMSTDSSRLTFDSQQLNNSILQTHTTSPVKESDRSPLLYASIFARRPNLMSRSSLGVSRFSLRHLDGPNCRSFALDHL